MEEVNPVLFCFDTIQPKRGDKKKKRMTEFLDELGLHLQDLKNRPTTTSKSELCLK
jgi:hypothetical protein